LWDGETQAFADRDNFGHVEIEISQVLEMQHFLEWFAVCQAQTSVAFESRGGFLGFGAFEVNGLPDNCRRRTSRCSFSSTSSPASLFLISEWLPR